MTLRHILAVVPLCGCAATVPPADPIAATLPSSPTRARHGVQVADIDHAQDPCVDFDAYANGAWRNVNPIPNSSDVWSRRIQAMERNDERLRGILEEISQHPDWPPGSAEQLVGDFYAACMDEARIDAQGITPIEPLLAEIDGIRSRAGLQRSIRRLNELGVPVPFTIRAGADPHQTTQTIAKLLASPGGELPDRDYYSRTEARFVDTRRQYKAHMARMFALAGLPDPVEAAYSLEERLAVAQLDSATLRNPKNTDHPMSFAELQRLTPHFDWATYFDQAHLPQIDLNVSEPGYLEAMDRELSRAALVEWRAYLKWQLLVSAGSGLSRPLRDEWFDFNIKYLAGVSEQWPRWKACTVGVDSRLGDALGRKYVERYFPPAAKARIQELVKNELAAMKEILGSVAWMGPDTRRRAMEKLAAMGTKIGYPERWKDYTGLEIHRHTYWLDVQALRQLEVAENRARVGKPTDRDRWAMTPPTVRAYYIMLLNEIVFPAGILQPPAFDPDAVDAVNYGGIGVVIGHEISHAFDDQGAQYDAQGRLENWWTAEDLAAFRERGDCVARQFEGYSIELGVHHNGRLVLGESIADLAGVRIAYLAFQKAQKEHPDAIRDGLTPDQQFFVAAAQLVGAAMTIESQRLMIESDPHPVPKFRVIGTLSNLPTFQQAFACKSDSAMVRPPDQRCEVW